MTTQIIYHIDGAVLYECEADTLRDAVVLAVQARANLRDAYLSGAYLIDAGQDSRGYRFVGTATDGVRVLAGCRWFTLDEARDHWRTNPEASNKVGLIAAEAKRRGWIQ